MKKAGTLILIVTLLLTFIIPMDGALAAEDNLLFNPGFELGSTEGWYPYGDCSIDVVDTDAHSGSYCVVVDDRTQEWNGVAQDMLDKLTVGMTYQISAWVKIVGTGSHQVKISMKKVDDGKEPVYDSITLSTVDGSKWYRLSGPYNYTGTDVTNLELYIEGPTAGVSYYVDDIAVTEVGSSATWKEEANARIEQIRKRDAKIKIVDSNNKPVSGVSLDVRQVKHDFGFGSAITVNAMYDSRYTEFFKDHYEWAVFENEAKWYSNESSQGNVSYANADSLYDWCAKNDIKVRGHCVFWEPDEWQPSWIKGLTGDALKKAIDARLDSVVPHFRGKFLHWDVNNEMLHGDFFKSRLGDSIWPYMFKRTRELDPDAKLFVNDFNIITYAEGDDYIRQIESLLENGAEIDGIGVQGHFDEAVDPLVVKARLDNLATLGIPIWVTEYDSKTPDVNKRAENLENLYRIAFSHPSVDGVIMWGYWAGVHWRGQDAAIVDQDWTINEAGRRYEALLEEWTTITSGTTDSKGAFDFRGFHGIYEVTVNVPGQESFVKTIELNKGEGTSVYTFTVDGTPVDPVLYGDMNQDGYITSTDLTVMKRYLLKIIEVPEKGVEAGDLNGDGKVNSTDLTILKRFLLKTLDKFPRER
ncbi:endo-1,4-beta-xylanase [Acetivibrio mesophilus]|uniref:Beta-xylanase n=1 Tax=Acetivibrio mesophilus TaxID=2487273 RepID=A0A4Q0I176_9FIRM|nr:endo-1,4-beta-xylanase [Acetivibrio mesophilus]RXE57948.1 glycoside hydrolase [Acetivibrio mesophilus]